MVPLKPNELSPQAAVPAARAACVGSAKPADEPEEANVLDDEGCHRQTVRTATKDSRKYLAAIVNQPSSRRPYRAQQWQRS